MEQIARQSAGAGRFDLVVFRAFRPLEPAILKGLSKLSAPGGILAAWKGRREAVQEEMARYENLAWELLPIEVPFLNEERHLLVVRG